MTTQRKRSQQTLGNRLNSIDDQLAQAQVTKTVAGENTVGPAAITTDAVTSDALAPDSVDSNALGRGAVGTENLGVVNEIDSDSTLVLKAPVAIALGGDGYPAPAFPMSLYLDTTGNLVPGGGPTVPVGAVVQWAGIGGIPSGWLLCDGSLLDRTTFATLYSVIGATYGSGDGSTTFKLPDFQGRVPVGGSASDTDFTRGTYGGAKTVAHSHTLSNAGAALFNYDTGHMYATRSGAITPWTIANYGTATWAGGSNGQGQLASGISLAGSSDSATASVVQPYLAINFIIKAV